VTTIKPRLATSSSIHPSKGSCDIAIKDLAIHLERHLGTSSTRPFLDPSSNDNGKLQSTYHMASVDNNQLKHLVKNKDVRITRPVSVKETRKKQEEYATLHHRRTIINNENNNNATSHPSYSKSAMVLSNGKHSALSSTHSHHSEETMDKDMSLKAASFTKLRINYLIVTVAIMLADGLQGMYNRQPDIFSCF
jgi:hypothetical protein